MEIVIRVDATEATGAGHLYRCVNLGTRLVALNHSVSLVGEVPTGMFPMLGKAGITPVPLAPQKSEVDDANTVSDLVGPSGVVVLDRLLTSHLWEQAVHSRVGRLVAFIDRPDRFHTVDIAISTALFSPKRDPFLGRLPRGAKAFVGPTFAPLSQYFFPEKVPFRTLTEVTEVRAFFGGSDPGEQMNKIIDVAREREHRLVHFTLLSGPMNRRHTEYEAKVRGCPNITLVPSVENMAEFWSNADLALGSYGMSAWERCAIGVGTIATTQAPDQTEDAEVLASRGAVIDLGESIKANKDEWSKALSSTLSDPKRIHKLAQASSQIMSGWSADSDLLISEITAPIP